MAGLEGCCLFGDLEEGIVDAPVAASFEGVVVPLCVELFMWFSQSIATGHGQDHVTGEIDVSISLQAQRYRLKKMAHAYRGGVEYPLKIWVVCKSTLDHLDSPGDISLS